MSRLQMREQAAIPMLLNCPACGKPHIDHGEWATKKHKTHLCLYCAQKWQPSLRATVGVVQLPSPND